MTLFVKTLLVLIATIGLTAVALRLSVVLDWFPGEGRSAPPGPIMLSVQMAEAIHAYETGGPSALRVVLDRMRKASGYRGILLDRRGVDLLKGEFHPEVLRDMPGRRPRFARGADRNYLARRSPDGRFIYAILLPRPQWFRFLLQPEFQISMLVVLLALSWMFAKHLTGPVADLRRAVERFGRGDLTARIHSERRDELGELGRTFDQMADRIQTLLTAERRLLLDMSHELRSPLARLALSVELARSGEDLHRHLDRIQQEADRLNALVGELLLVTRAEGDPSQLRREPLDLQELTTQIVENARIEATSRKAGVELNSEPVEVMADRELVHRAIENVVRNAIRFTPPGTAVQVHVGRENGRARITVRGFGPGVPEESLSRIFDAFYRVETDRNRATGATGLGLSIAKRALDLHGGAIQARNSVPGLTVALELPAA